MPVARYEPHRPEDTRLYRLVAEHLETFLADAREHDDRGLPPYVERELRDYLRCGIHAYGFLRARCRQCRREIFVAFSCEKRGICPSCSARRMCGTATHLVEHVLPDVPVRQWVLSIPYELRLLLARDPRVLSAVGRIFVTEILRWQREQAGLRGLRGARGGAICFPQRFGGSLNLNVHFHVAVPDGVFTLAGDAERPAFHALPGPKEIEMDTLALNVEVRVLAWLRRRGLIANDDDASGGAVERSALDACLAGSLGMGELTALPAGRAPAPDDHEWPPRLSKTARKGGNSRGFDIHAGVVVAGSDREGRERLLRYCARPPLSLERLSVLPDGRVAYELRKPWGHQTHRVMSPVAFLARLAALIPPPRHPLVRFFGVLAPHAAWRKKIVPVRTGCSSGNDPRCGAGHEAEAPRAVKQEPGRSAADLAPCTVLANLPGEPSTSATCSATAAPVYCAPCAPLSVGPHRLGGAVETRLPGRRAGVPVRWSAPVHRADPRRGDGTDHPGERGAPQRAPAHRSSAVTRLRRRPRLRRRLAIAAGRPRPKGPPPDRGDAKLRARRHPASTAGPPLD